MAATNMTQRLSFVSFMQIPSLSMKQQLGSSITHRNEHTQCRHNTKSQPHGDRHGLFNNLRKLSLQCIVTDHLHTMPKLVLGSTCNRT